MNRIRLTGFLLLAAYGLSPGAIFAQSAEYEFRVGVGRSDNIGRTPSNEISETVGLLGLDLSYEKEARLLDSEIQANLEYRNYRDSTFSNEFIGAANLEFDVNLVPGFWTWAIDNRYGNLQIDPFAPETPQNRENINNFSTGPDFRLVLGSQAFMEVAARYEDNYFEVSETDNSNSQARVTLGRALSRNRSISLNATTEAVDFDNDLLNTDFDRHRAFLGFNSEGANGELELNIGYNTVDNGLSEFDGNFVSILVARNIRTSTRFEFSADRRLTDASELFREADQPDFLFGETQRVTGVGEPVERYGVQMLLRRDRNAVSLYLMATGEDLDYQESNDQDLRRYQFRIGGGRPLGSAWRIRLDAGYVRTSFEESGRDDDSYDVLLTIGRQLSRSLSLSLELTRFDQDSSDDALDYVENVAYLTFRYSR